MSLSDTDLKSAQMNLSQRKDMLSLNPLLADLSKSLSVLVGESWKFSIDLPSLKSVSCDTWFVAMNGLKILVEGITKDLREMDLDSLTAMKNELGESKIISLVYDEVKTSSLSAGCVAIAYESGCIVVYWRTLPKMLYPHAGKSIGDYIVDNCHSPEEVLSQETKKNNALGESLYFDGVGELAPTVISRGFIGITAFHNLDDWRKRNRKSPTYICLRVSQIETIIPINEGNNRCSEITTNHGSYYISFHPAGLLDLISEAEKFKAL